MTNDPDERPVPGQQDGCGDDAPFDATKEPPHASHVHSRLLPHPLGYNGDSEGSRPACAVLWLQVLRRTPGERHDSCALLRPDGH